jgi:hypothetical protein
MLNNELIQCGTHRVPQQYDCKLWALAWPTDQGRKGYNNCYTESE